jgi:thymidylate kinase
MSQREEFLQYFFNAIRKSEYVLLKFVHGSIDEIPSSSDLDLLISQKKETQFIDIIRKGSNIENVFQFKKSFATFISIVFNDDSYLEIDLLYAFDRKGIIFLDAPTVLKSSYLNEHGIRLPALKYAAEYMILFYLINKSDVAKRYADFLTSLSFENRSEIFGYLCHKYDLTNNKLDELFLVKKRGPKKMIQKIKAYPQNTKFKKFKNKLRYLSDLVHDLTSNKGIIVSFSGVDGAGKSTVLERVKKLLQHKYRHKTIILRHRPGLFPILSSILHGKKKAEEISKYNLPRKGTNESSISSVLRFGYYYLDYLLGQIYIYFKYTLRGYTVLYDRYYFDFIIDPKRSNIKLPKALLKLGYYFVIKPEVNIFLYANSDIILSRKQEMNEEDIKLLTSEYKELFEEFSKSYKNQQYLSINNTNIEQTLDDVMKQCVLATH